MSDEAGPERSLPVLRNAFRGRGGVPRLKVKEIPKQALSRCARSLDDHSLRVESPPQEPPELGQRALFDEEDVR